MSKSLSDRPTLEAYLDAIRHDLRPNLIQSDAGTVAVYPALSPELRAAAVMAIATHAVSELFGRVRTVAQAGFLLRTYFTDGHPYQPDGSSRVEVVRGKSCPVGFYRVARHFYADGPAVLNLHYFDYKGRKKREHPRVPLECCRVLPDWSHVARYFGPTFGPFAATFCENEFNPTSFLTYADYLDEGNPLGWWDYEARGIPLDAMATQLRGIGNWSNGHGDRTPGRHPLSGPVVPGPIVNAYNNRPDDFPGRLTLYPPAVPAPAISPPDPTDLMDLRNLS